MFVGTVNKSQLTADACQAILSPWRCSVILVGSALLFGTHGMLQDLASLVPVPYCLWRPLHTTVQK
jgi:hypothetical protein